VGDQWLDEASRPRFDDALARAGAGERVTVTLTFTNTLYPVDLVLEMVRLGDGPSRAVMAVMIDAVSREAEVPLRPATGFVYEVALQEGRPSILRRMLGSDAHPVRGIPGRPCWEQVFGRHGECPECPLRGLPSGERGSAVAPSGPGSFSPMMLSGHRRGETAIVSAVPVGEDVYDGLIKAKIDHLAAEAHLTPREREMLSLLLMGRSLEELALATGLTQRTAKYHQQKLLKKLGADSRVDLARLIL
jgi:DNA-binding CsgD family transcriptional regulator